MIFIDFFRAEFFSAINLASLETLERISITEQGSLEPVPRYPNFRLFACMKPATDVDKDLPPSICSGFVEIDIPPPNTNGDALLSIVTQCVGPSAVGDKTAIMNVAEFILCHQAISRGAPARRRVEPQTALQHAYFRPCNDLRGRYGWPRRIVSGRSPGKAA